VRYERDQPGELIHIDIKKRLWPWRSRITAMLRTSGWRVNAKRMQRIWRR
jgi:transposase InsO family protein